jgi:hypothetical protein
MSSIYKQCLALLLLGMSASSVSGQVIERKDFAPLVNGIPGEEHYEKLIDIGHGIRANAVIDVTTKGNGTLSVSNLRLHVLDEHDDGEVFVGGLLHAEFVDINQDGYKDLVIYGISEQTGEKEGDPVSFAPVVSIYIFNPLEKCFKLRFRCGTILDWN